MTPEALLAKDHYDLKAKGLQARQYGKCGNNAQGQVVFKNGEVLYWTQPDF